MDGCIAPFRIALLIDETVFDQKKETDREICSRDTAKSSAISVTGISPRASKANKISIWVFDRLRQDKTSLSSLFF
jgi:hypothetical protein